MLKLISYKIINIILLTLTKRNRKINKIYGKDIPSYNMMTKNRKRTAMKKSNHNLFIKNNKFPKILIINHQTNLIDRKRIKISNTKIIKKHWKLKNKLIASIFKINKLKIKIRNLNLS